MVFPDSNSPSEPFPVPGGWTIEVVQIGPQKTNPQNTTSHSHKIKLSKPAHPDALLDDPQLLAENESTVYIPYWSTLWPASIQMANTIVQHNWEPGLKVLELGCGMGLVGLSALAAGLNVTFSDYRPEAVRLACWNARQNRFNHTSVQFEGLELDWNAPPANLKFDLILGCDLLYETDFHSPLLAAVQQLLNQNGTCWLADPGRSDADRFYSIAAASGWKTARLDQNLNQQHNHQIGQFQIFSLSR